MATEAKILIVDMGSQYTSVIERSLRNCGYRSAVLSPKKAGDWMRVHGASAVIISGGDKSIHDQDAPGIPFNILSADNTPILGICYGMQWLANHYGGEVKHRQDQTGFGPTDVQLGHCDLFDSISISQNVWASHGDSVTKLPEGAVSIATDGNGSGIKAMHVPARNIWGVQFHPEVENTACGEQILMNFVVDICGCESDWVQDDIIETIRGDYDNSEMRVIHGFSGGVDSTVGAAILSPVLGDRLQCICIDAGHLRQGEPDEIRLHAKAAGVDLLMIEAEDRFFDAMVDITDAEEKRAAFKCVYNAIFLEEAAKFDATHVVQGTLATDLIESGATGGAVIKSHHNVGLNWGNLQDLHPLCSLFKYEVRELAATLGLPDSVTHREPFPGPGLFLRMPGVVTKERRDRIRWADHEVRQIFYGDPDAPEVSQLVIALNDTPVVGVKGDARVYEEMVVVRPVKTIDFMTASAPIFSPELMTKIMTRVAQHPELLGVWWDFMPKPPRTTELE